VPSPALRRVASAPDHLCGQSFNIGDIVEQVSPDPGLLAHAGTRSHLSAPEDLLLILIHDTGGPLSDELELAARTLVEERIRALRMLVGRDLGPGDVVLRPTPTEARTHLFEEACELYWNEMSWEQITDEELTDGEELTEMVFPALLTLVDALLPRGANGEPDRAREHRDVAHDFLCWLAARLVELRERREELVEEKVQKRRETTITDELIDLVTFRLYLITDDEISRLKRVQ